MILKKKEMKRQQREKHVKKYLEFFYDYFEIRDSLRLDFEIRSMSQKW